MLDFDKTKAKPKKNKTWWKSDENIEISVSAYNKIYLHSVLCLDFQLCQLNKMLYELKNGLESSAISQHREKIEQT